MKKLKKPDPGNIPTTDKPADYTGEDAPERTLLINLGFIKYGTNDKFQGAATFFSFLFLILIALLLVASVLSPVCAAATASALTWLEAVFTLIVGVAIGKALPGTRG